MQSLSVQEAEAALPDLIEALESGAVTEIVLTREGKTVALLQAIAKPKVFQRIGVAQGKTDTPEPDLEQDAIVAARFNNPEGLSGRDE